MRLAWLISGLSANNGGIRRERPAVQSLNLCCKEVLLEHQALSEGTQNCDESLPIILGE